MEQTIKFDWDQWNAQKNETKHGVSNVEAESAFFDDGYSLFEDIMHSTKKECRYILFEEEDVMKCIICKKGETHDGKAIITLNRNGTTLVIRNVPAQVCQNCGEEYVDGETTTRLLKTADESARNGTLVDIREYMAA